MAISRAQVRGTKETRRSSDLEQSHSAVGWQRWEQESGRVLLRPPLFYPFFDAAFISRCVNTALSAHTALCKLFKHSSGRTQTSRREPRHSQRQEQLFFGKLPSPSCWERGGGTKWKERFLLYQVSQPGSALPPADDGGVLGTVLHCASLLDHTCCYTSLDVEV